MKKTKDIIQGEALVALKDKRMSGIEVSMGVGKTRIGLKHMHKLYTSVSRYLVVAPRKSIIKSWKDEIEETKMGHLEPCIVYSTYRSLTKQDYDYDVIYLDECHSLKATHNEWLKNYLQKGGRIVGLTGTYPIYKKTEKGKMCYFYCPKVYTYKTDDAVADDLLNDYKIVVHELNLSSKPTISKEGKHGEFKTSELKDYGYWTSRVGEASSAKEKQIVSVQRMRAMMMFPSKETYAKHLFEEQLDKTILFANTQDQADRLCTDSYHSKNDDSDYNLGAFKRGHISKLSAVEQLSEGVTVPGLKVGIIMHSYSNNRKAAQKIGRMLRLNPDETATVHILCYSNSVDKIWVQNALKAFDKTKITWIKAKVYVSEPH